MKLGYNTHLKVDIPSIDVDSVSKIEFVFKKSTSVNASLIKVSEYPSDVEYLDGYFFIPWSSEETYLVEAGSKFFMDTRITLKNDTDQPETNIVELIMHPSLFKE